LFLSEADKDGLRKATFRLHRFTSSLDLLKWIAHPECFRIHGTGDLLPKGFSL
jgi:hypothetical protein